MGERPIAKRTPAGRVVAERPIAGRAPVNCFGRGKMPPSLRVARSGHTDHLLRCRRRELQPRWEQP